MNYDITSARANRRITSGYGGTRVQGATTGRAVFAVCLRSSNRINYNKMHTRTHMHVLRCRLYTLYCITYITRAGPSAEYECDNNNNNNNNNSRQRAIFNTVLTHTQDFAVGFDPVEERASRVRWNSRFGLHSFLPDCAFPRPQDRTCFANSKQVLYIFSNNRENNNID